jgi:hypothetical protein
MRGAVYTRAIQAKGRCVFVLCRPLSFWFWFFGPSQVACPVRGNGVLVSGGDNHGLGATGES